MAQENGNIGFQARYSTIIQSVTVVALFVAGFWAGVISPMSTRMDKLESNELSRAEHLAFQKEIDGKVAEITIELNKLQIGREKDGDQLAKLYTSILTNDEYKKIVATEFTWSRSDFERLRQRVERTEEEQKRRSTAVATVATLESRMDRLDRRNEEQDRRSVPTILEELKTLRTELDNLRQRIMVPVSSIKP